MEDKILNHIKAICNACKQNFDEIYVEVTNNNKAEVYIHIEWGDWKHDHQRLDLVMKTNGFKKNGEFITDEDNSDCYCSDHTYIIDIDNIDFNNIVDFQ